MADATPQVLDLTPEIINIECQQGTDVVVEFQLTDNAGTAVDLTTETVEFTAKDGFGGEVTIATKANGPGQHSDASTGKTVFVLTKTDTATATPTDQVGWKYEVRRVFAISLREVVYIHGDLTLMPSVGTSA